MHRSGRAGVTAGQADADRHCRSRRGRGCPTRLRRMTTDPARNNGFIRSGRSDTEYPMSGRGCTSGQRLVSRPSSRVAHDRPVMAGRRPSHTRPLPTLGPHQTWSAMRRLAVARRPGDSRDSRPSRRAGLGAAHRTCTRSAAVGTAGGWTSRAGKPIRKHNRRRTTSLINASPGRGGNDEG